MTTTTITTGDRLERREARAGARVSVGKLGLGAVAFLSILVSAWGGVVPFIGPSFGFGATGTGSWHWNMGHALLGLAPGAVGLAVGVLILAETKGITVGRGRLSLSALGFLLMLCGAWFVVGPAVWPVITTHSSYFVTAGARRALMNELGYSLGTGIVLAAGGAFTIGWAARHGAPEAAVPTEDVSPELV